MIRKSVLLVHHRDAVAGGKYPNPMAAYLDIVLYISCTGDRISIMIADFYQGDTVDF